MGDDGESVGVLLVGDWGGGGSGMERSDHIRDTFWCGIVLVQDLLLSFDF